jgi:hypothetical protein
MQGAMDSHHHGSLIVLAAALDFAHAAPRAGVRMVFAHLVETRLTDAALERLIAFARVAAITDPEIVLWASGAAYWASRLLAQLLQSRGICFGTLLAFPSDYLLEILRRNAKSTIIICSSKFAKRMEMPATYAAAERAVACVPANSKKIVLDYLRMIYASLELVHTRDVSMKRIKKNAVAEGDPPPAKKRKKRY